MLVGLKGDPIRGGELKHRYEKKALLTVMECEMLCKNPPFASVSPSTSALPSSQHLRLWIASLGSRNDGNGCCRLSMARLLRIMAMNRNGANAWWRWITLIAELAMHSVTATCTKPCNAHREAFWRGKGWATISAELNGVAVEQILKMIMIAFDVFVESIFVQN